MIRMKIQKAVRDETLHILTGTALLCGVMLLVFLVIGQFDCTVALGALLGGTAAVLNFFLLGLTVQKATAPGNEGRSRAIMQFSYSVRMLATMGIAFIGFAAPCFHWIAVLCPLLFPRITIFFMGLKKSEGKEDA